MGDALMENRKGLNVDCELTWAAGTAEREAALTRIEYGSKATGKSVRRACLTLIADKGFGLQLRLGQGHRRRCEVQGQAGCSGRRCLHAPDDCQ